jgi:hypothetical protein
MSVLTEREIFDRLVASFKQAAEDCDALAKRPVSSPAYLSLRDELALIEGCFQQAAFWREDDRWLEIARQIPEAHRLAGEWLRGVEVESNTPGVVVRRPIPEGELHPMFVKLAEFLRWCAMKADEMRHAKTGKMGANLAPLPPGRRNISYSGWTATGSGLIVPASAA